MNADYRRTPPLRVGPTWALRTLYRISGAEHELQYMQPHRPEFFIKAVMVREFVLPGWRRHRNGRSEHIEGWRLWMHRICWGFSGLTHVTFEGAWQVWPFDERIGA